MWKKFLKKSGWTDIIVSLIFILFGIILVTRPEAIISIFSLVVGMIFVAISLFKIVEYFSTYKKDRYLLAISLIAIITRNSNNVLHRYNFIYI